MWNPFLKVEWLKEGRNIRLPMMLIFYNAILAFITVFNYKHDSDWNDICTHAFFGMGILFNR